MNSKYELTSSEVAISAGLAKVTLVSRRQQSMRRKKILGHPVAPHYLVYVSLARKPLFCNRTRIKNRSLWWRTQNDCIQFKEDESDECDTATLTTTTAQLTVPKTNQNKKIETNQNKLTNLIKHTRNNRIELIRFVVDKPPKQRERQTKHMLTWPTAP